MLNQNLNKHIRSVLATSALCLMGAPTMAADQLVFKETDFKALDTNQDGYLDAMEAGAMPELAALLKTADKDSDGKLSESEFRAAIKSSKPAKP